MDESVYKGLEGFEAVWRRVTGAAEPGGDAARLRGLIQAEADAAAFYLALARRCAGAARVLHSIAADDARHRRLLQLEYFLLTGDTFAPVRRSPDADSGLRSLREGYILKQQSERTYRALGDKFAALADDEACHARSLRAAIADAFGR